MTEMHGRPPPDVVERREFEALVKRVDELEKLSAELAERVQESCCDCFEEQLGRRIDRALRGLLGSSPYPGRPAIREIHWVLEDCWCDDQDSLVVKVYLGSPQGRVRTLSDVTECEPVVEGALRAQHVHKPMSVSLLKGKSPKKLASGWRRISQGGRS